MQTNTERLVAGAGEAAASAVRADQRGELFALAVSCAGRREVLGERAEEETESTLASLPAGTLQMGFYAYGEIAPNGQRVCDLHNQTMTLTTLSEA